MAIFPRESCHHECTLDHVHIHFLRHAKQGWVTAIDSKSQWWKSSKHLTAFRCHCLKAVKLSMFKAVNCLKVVHVCLPFVILSLPMFKTTSPVPHLLLLLLLRPNWTLVWFCCLYRTWSGCPRTRENRMEMLFKVKYVLFFPTFGAKKCSLTNIRLPPPLGTKNACGVSPYITV